MWRNVADHICGDTQGNYYLIVTFNSSFFFLPVAFLPHDLTITVAF